MGQNANTNKYGQAANTDVYYIKIFQYVAISVHSIIRVHSIITERWEI